MSGEEFARQVHLFAERPCSLICFRNIRCGTAGNERKAQGILEPDFLVHPPGGVGNPPHDIQAEPEIRGSLGVGRASRGDLAGREPLGHRLLILLGFGKVIGEKFGSGIRENAAQGPARSWRAAAGGGI